MEKMSLGTQHLRTLLVTHFLKRDLMKKETNENRA